MKLLIITQKVDGKDQLLGFFISWLLKFSEYFSKITVLCLEKGEFSLPKNIEVVSLGKGEGKPKIIQLLNFYNFIINKKDIYDSVFVHMNPIWVVLGGIPWRIMKKRIYFWYTHKAVTTKLRIAEKFAHVIFTASPESFRIKSEKVIVTGHGIDTDLFRPDPELKTKNGVLKILSVGRIAPVKNYEILVEAAKILLEKGMNFEVLMIGEPALEKDREYEKNLKSKIEKLDLGNHFKFTGKIEHDELPKYYQSCDVFVHLSKTGSLDKTILEAMACGMKVLSSNDAARNFLRSDSIFSENNPRELAEKIDNLGAQTSPQCLQEHIIQNHDLKNLIYTISRTINHD